MELMPNSLEIFTNMPNVKYEISTITVKHDLEYRGLLIP